MAKVKLDWTNPVTGETGIEIERSVATPPVGGTTIATLPADSITYTDMSAPLGAVSYRVRAVNTSVTPNELGAWTGWTTVTVTAMMGSLFGLNTTQIP